MIISARPYPSISTLFNSEGRFELNGFNFFPLGRNALLSGLIALGLQKGDGVIVPAYMCNSTIEPMQAYGLKVIFVDIVDGLDFSVEKISQVLKQNDKIKALLLVHYFGLTQNMNEVVDTCQKYGVKVVEDASHSLMSQLFRNKDSIKSDAEIFCMRKSLPINDGGALRMNNGSYDMAKKSNNQCVSIISDVKYLMLRFFEILVAVLGINIYGQFINNIKTKLRTKINYEIHDLNVQSCQASWQLRRYLGSEKYLQNAQQKVVDNFIQLSKTLQSLGYRLFVKSIEDNVVPQACIIYDDKGGLVEYLRSNGIGAWRWPDEDIPREVANNSDQYPNAIKFNSKLVLLPIHQSITKKHILYMSNILGIWSSKGLTK